MDSVVDRVARFMSSLESRRFFLASRGEIRFLDTPGKLARRGRARRPDRKL
jgi:hypothetical protein